MVHMNTTPTEPTTYAYLLTHNVCGTKTVHARTLREAKRIYMERAERNQAYRVSYSAIELVERRKAW